MANWDQEFVGLVSPGHIAFVRAGSRELHFGAVDATLDWRVDDAGQRVDFSPVNQQACAPMEPVRNRNLADAVAFVTGAASGIGAAIARRLAAQGAKTVAADINVQGGGRVVQVRCASPGSGPRRCGSRAGTPRGGHHQIHGSKVRSSLRNGSRSGSSCARCRISSRTPALAAMAKARLSQSRASGNRPI
jgi:hypothetical protein